MPALNEFLPPLLGGFLFSLLFTPLRLYLARTDGYRLLFAITTAAFFLQILAALIHHTLTSLPLFNERLAALAVLPSLAGLEQGLIAFVLGPILAAIFNMLWRLAGRTPAESTYRFITSRADPFEMVLMEFLKSQDLLMVTLRSGKVYIGKVMTSINPARNIDSIRLALFASGHRDQNTHVFSIDVRYDETHSAIRNAVVHSYEAAIEEYLENSIDATLSDLENEIFGAVDTSKLGVVNFETVILASEIQSLSPFEPKIYEEHFDQS